MRARRRERCRVSHTAAIALGSNLSSVFGDPAANVGEAIQRIERLGNIRAISSLYRTAPVELIDQPDFINAALLLETTLAPVELMRSLLGIEQAMGRNRANTPAKGPRIIDLDLLLMDDLIVETPELSLPHPAMTTRRFVLEPLTEIAPEMIHPIARTTVAELLARTR
jgi:2-amino-4-hydroxy-6-hydroxymethyldihydropteridine diphosphokinase